MTLKVFLTDKYKEVNDTRIFDTLKARVTVQQAAAHYGVKVDRSGMRRCPFHSDKTPSMKINETYLADYLQGSETAFASTAEKQIEQIILQKYIATFMQSPFSGFFEYRRTGYPHFIINPESNRNTPTDKMPVRWMYSQDEYNYNAENVNTAVQSQFNGVDDNNQLMWILK